jgi:hypothetical protein
MKISREELISEFEVKKGYLLAGGDTSSKAKDDMKETLAKMVKYDIINTETYKELLDALTD